SYFSSQIIFILIRESQHNLRKLSCEVEGELSDGYHILDFPTRLEILRIYKVRYSSENIPFCISAPNLKSLTISGFRLNPQNLSAIAQLQNLQVLKLYYVRFGYPSKWKVNNGEFPQLKVLKLQRHCPLEEWTVADDAFPNLEQLFLDSCRSLKEIPSSLGDISSLKYIEVTECNESVAKSAREIRETQVEDYQNADFKLFMWKNNSGTLLRKYICIQSHYKLYKLQMNVFQMMILQMISKAGWRSWLLEAGT
uniref:Late blight resistance protein homolog R1A-4 n=1 Tax=Nicotiana tabacum TaxID=4097 RepID=A0A1S4D0T9_TOBAC